VEAHEAGCDIGDGVCHLEIRDAKV
jgi:hypothetical protein